MSSHTNDTQTWATLKPHSLPAKQADANRILPGKFYLQSSPSEM